MDNRELKYKEANRWLLKNAPTEVIEYIKELGDMIKAQADHIELLTKVIDKIDDDINKAKDLTNKIF